jgi:hypothetical protein
MERIISIKSNQKIILGKYWNLLNVTMGDIAIASDTSIETVRRTKIGVQGHTGVLNQLYNQFIKVEKWNGKLPADLAELFQILNIPSNES